MIVSSPSPSRTRASFVPESSVLENVSNDGAGLGGRAVGVGSGRGEGMVWGVGDGVGVGDDAGVGLGVGIGEGVGVTIGVGVRVAIGAIVGVTVTTVSRRGSRAGGSDG